MSQRRRTPSRAAALAGLFAGAWSACATAPPAVATQAVPGWPANDFPGASALLSGFDPIVDRSQSQYAVPAAEDWRAGDQVLFGLRLRTAAGERRWLLHVGVIEPLAIARAGDDDAVAPGGPLPDLHWSLTMNDQPTEFASRRCRVRVTVADAMGQVLGVTEPLLPRDLLSNGFAAACQLVERQRALGMPQRLEDFYASFDLQPLTAAAACAIAVLQVMQDDRVLSPLLWEVVQRPSLWSVATSLGVRVVLEPAFHACTRVPAPAPAGPVAWRVPMRLLVNGEPALALELDVGSAEAPFAPCGGVFAATAHHPQDGAREFALALLAARRGG